MKECILSALFMFGMTSLGACLVMFFKGVKSNLHITLVGVASGIMFASSVFSLIIPSLEMSAGMGAWFWVPTAVGVVSGFLLLLSLDRAGRLFGKSRLDKSHKLFLAMTLHNIPEGLAVGVAFGAFVGSGDPALMASAVALAIGIGVQNLPEGFAVSLPLYACGLSKSKSALLGVASGAVEPIFAVLGVYLAVTFSGLLPWLLALSAGCMLAVTVNELIPDLKGTTLGTFAFALGFIIMLILDNLNY